MFLIKTGPKQQQPGEIRHTLSLAAIWRKILTQVTSFDIKIFPHRVTGTCLLVAGGTKREREEEGNVFDRARRRARDGEAVVMGEGGEPGENTHRDLSLPPGVLSFSKKVLKFGKKKRFCLLLFVPHIW